MKARFFSGPICLFPGKAISKNRETGSAMIEGLISIGLIALVFSSLSMLATNLTNLSNRSLMNESSVTMANSLRMALENPVSWQYTVDDPYNTILECVRMKRSCKDVAPGNLSVVKLTANENYYKKGNNGFTTQGDICNLSDKQNCKVVANIKVTYICNKPVSVDYPIADDCKSPQINLEVTFSPASSGSDSGLLTSDTTHQTESSFDAVAPINYDSLRFTLIKAAVIQPCGLGCRDVAVPANDPLFKKPDLKVVLVVDNSASMSLAQYNLSKGVESLVAKLADLTKLGNNRIEFFIYTTTDPLVGIRSATTEFLNSNMRMHSEYVDPVTGESKSYAYHPDKWNNNYTFIRNNFDLRPTIWLQNFPTSPVLTNATPPPEMMVITRDLANDPAWLTQFSDKLRYLISHIGTDGASKEAGLCTLNRLVYEEGANRLFTPGDKALFFVLTNENDFSTSSECSTDWRSFSVEDTTKSVPCDPKSYPVNGDKYCPQKISYSLTAELADLKGLGIKSYGRRLQLQCNLGNDKSVYTDVPLDLPYERCTPGTATVSCPAPHYTNLGFQECSKKAPGVATTLRSCKLECVEMDFKCAYDDVTPPLDGDLCSNLTAGELFNSCISGTALAAAPTNVFSCTRQLARHGKREYGGGIRAASFGYEPPSGVGAPGTVDLQHSLEASYYDTAAIKARTQKGLRDENAANLTAAFIKKAEERFGPRGVGFQTYAVIHDPVLDLPFRGIDSNSDGVADCQETYYDEPWNGSQTEGIYYRTLTKITGGSYQSICAPDYGKVLGDLDSMSISINDSSITLPKDFLSVQERIAAIFLNGTEMKMGVDVILTYPTIQFLTAIEETATVTFRVERVSEVPRTIAAVNPEDGTTVNVDGEDSSSDAAQHDSKYGNYLKRLFSRFLWSQ